MSDPRFARFKTDPRFRRIKKDEGKVVVDERFKGVFDADKKKKKGKKDKVLTQNSCQDRVDKYGRPLADTHEQDNLRRFYRLEDEEKSQPEATTGPDYARGAVLLESSDEEDNREPASEDDESDAASHIVLGRDISKPIPVPDDEAEIDLDEDAFAELDAQAAAYARENPELDGGGADEGQRTRRLAVVNLDWEHVRAIHLYKIFSSLVSLTAPPLAPRPVEDTAKDARKGRAKGSAARVVRGKVLSVRVYPSEFGKERMAREEKEGPPPEVFKKKTIENEDDINERTIFEVGDGEDYDEDALRKYQLERLRYYYAIVDCDSVEAASHIYSELEGTELERSANVFDLSFVPEDMTFDQDCRDEAVEDYGATYKALDFRTDALRHSKVKLTWDEDDPQRVQLTRRALSRKELDENDFKAYLASSTSGSEDEDERRPRKGADAKAASRDKLRALLLGGGDDLPEGWGQSKGEGDEDDIDMEITFTPGLSNANEGREETTLEKYQRKMKEKKKKRKEEVKERDADEQADKETGARDDFFAGGSEDEGAESGVHGEGEKEERHISTAEELALLAASDNVDGEAKHFNMKAVLKAEKKQKLKKKRGKKAALEEENELQEDFNIDLKDERFKAVHDDHAFAIDPSNPRFKKTKSMAALLGERSKRQKEKTGADVPVTAKRQDTAGKDSLKSLVESVKRKSAAAEQQPGKRRKT
ncbi:hypothetical protein IEO21_00114 [Rhodonia placenta]|uniref:NUC153 domain-containing protein n=1 Tax=Rhodonia placenta TaxID=104341 RepID=A0A8H7U7L9_9APHY|nr:hypothetical protein IEO21_00114 [Postia placenta]